MTACERVITAMSVASVRPPILIAIGGGSGSGKTTLALALQRRLSVETAVVLAEDNYHRSFYDDRDFNPATFNFDHISARDHDLLRSHLLALKCGRAVEQGRYSFLQHRHADEYDVVVPASFIIVEGLHVLSSPLHSLFDVRVYVDVPADIRLARRIIRDITHRGRDVGQVVESYLRQVRGAHAEFVCPTRSNANLVLRDTSPNIEIDEQVQTNFVRSILRLVAQPAISSVSMHERDVSASDG